MRSAIDTRAKEKDLYDYERSGFNNKTGHATQLVWKDTREVGVGVAQMDNGAFLYVAKFSPPGNVNDANAFRQNVSRQ
jgi:hypothetical protein